MLKWRNLDQILCYNVLILKNHIKNLGPEDTNSRCFVNLWPHNHYKTVRDPKMHFDTMHFDKMHFDKMHYDKIHFEKMHFEKMHFDKMNFYKMHFDKMYFDKMHFDIMHSNLKSQNSNLKS